MNELRNATGFWLVATGLTASASNGDWRLAIGNWRLAQLQVLQLAAGLWQLAQLQVFQTMSFFPYEIRAVDFG